jgi:hypothetical protein
MAQRFASEFADDLTSKAVVGAGLGGAIAYDGDNLFGYCVYFLVALQLIQLQSLI